MSTNEQDREASRAISTINQERTSTILVDGERVASLQTVFGEGLAGPFVALTVGPEPTGCYSGGPSVYLGSVEECDELINKLRVHREQLAEVVDAARGGQVVEALAGTPLGRFWADAVDAEREGRAA